MSININYKIGKSPVDVKGFSIPPGTVFLADKVGAYEGQALYLRIGGEHARGIVSLSDPTKFFTHVNPTVVGYQPVDVDINVL